MGVERGSGGCLWTAWACLHINCCWSQHLINTQAQAALPCFPSPPPHHPTTPTPPFLPSPTPPPRPKTTIMLTPPHSHPTTPTPPSPLPPPLPPPHPHSPLPTARHPHCHPHCQPHPPTPTPLSPQPDPTAPTQDDDEPDPDDPSPNTGRVDLSVQIRKAKRHRRLRTLLENSEAWRFANVVGARTPVIVLVTAALHVVLFAVYVSLVLKSRRVLGGVTLVLLLFLLLL